MDDLFALDPTKIAKWVEALNADHSLEEIVRLSKYMESVMIQLKCAHTLLDEAGIKKSVMRAHVIEDQEYHFLVEERLSFLVRQIERLFAQGPRWKEGRPNGDL